MSVAVERKGWSTLNVALHWLIVLLVVVQFVNHEWMVDLWRATTRGEPITPDTEAWGWSHIVTGALILAAAAGRLLDRFANGRPPYPAEDPTWAKNLARLTHALIYAILIVMPILGIVAWTTHNPIAATIHTTLWTPLLILIGLHIVGALTQHFYFRTDVLRRMLKPGA